tara:strand:+ start:2938 stop:3153 length:216 start_codon:yes stop_codon:yes gene_type:complete
MGNLYDELKDFEHLQKQLDAYVDRLEKVHYQKIDGQARKEALQNMEERNDHVSDTPDIDSIAERNYENRKS